MKIAAVRSGQGRFLFAILFVLVAVALFVVDCGGLVGAVAHSAQQQQQPQQQQQSRERSRERTRDGSATCFVTTEDGKFRLDEECAPPIPTTTAPNSSASWQVHVNSSHPQQEILGFGAAWTDAAVTVFDSLPSDTQDAVLEALFSVNFSASPSPPIGLSLMRHTIGQSDLTPASIGEWSFDSTPNDVPDPSLAHFNLTAPGERMVSWLQRMLTVTANASTTLLGSIWSPPQWMKNNNNLRFEQVDAWVGYLVKYLLAYRENGVNVDAITMQNEPLHSADPAWTMYMDASYQSLLANRLAPALAAAGLKTELWAYDHNTDRPDYPQAVLDNTTRATVNTVAWHCYAPGNPDAVWTPLRNFASRNPGVRQVMTECWTHVGSGENFFDLPTFIGRPLQYGAAGAMAWTVGGSSSFDVSYPGGCAQCSGLLQVNMSSGTVTKTQDFYTMGHYSRFVRPGDRYLNVTGGNYDYPDGTGVQVNAFLRVSAAAAGGEQRTVVIQNKIRNDLDVQVTFSNDAWIGVVPARSIVTWVLE